MDGLSRLLRPRSIAVIGGGTWCAAVVEGCRRIGFAGPVWPVHPTRAEIGGVPAFASIEALPEAPDATFIGVNRNTSIEALRALAARGSGGAVCFASGFRESVAETGDGHELEAALVEAAGAMRILGPNCYGFLNFLDGAALWPDQHGAERVTEGVAIVTQSSNLALNLTMQSRGLPLAYVVTVGNQAQTGMAEIAEALLEDPRVTALGLHVEGVGDLARFAAMAGRARTLGKPVAVLKSGASEAARAAAMSHTGSLAGSDAGASALFDRLGMARVRSPAELLETLKLLHAVGPLPSARIGVLSSSGGEAGLISDMVAARALECPPLSQAQRTALRAALGPKVALANPLDYHTYIWGDREALARTFTAMLAPDMAMGVAILDFPRPDRCDAGAWEIVIDAAEDAVKAAGRPMAILSSLTETIPEATAQAMLTRGIVPLCGFAEGLAALEAAARLGSMTGGTDITVPGAEPEAPRLLNEAEAKEALSRHGVPVPRSRMASSPREAAGAAAELGFPVVLKALGLAHKTEAGAVAVGLASATEVEAAALRMASDRYLVEDMVSGTVAELLVGVIRDPAHGFVLTLGAGGVLAEILADTVSLLLPATAAEIDVALDRLRIAPLLSGYRGRPAIDRAALLAAIAAVQDYALTHADTLVELEVNPLIVTAEGAVAVDALIRLGEPR
ncbi:acetate--CoA ligase family protein [Roseibacterium sp. SDUM158016]|uniref:acetate--CoA ligase family protein n=1 Tax=Roseicyclus sediminis TaxID=2980997 RepID=UPI0021CF96F9|nr:acetate--CoA ligase family protein [Roseibacterium sp. SDUM158016]MCU4652019.1 acetate--CoA ligase family protein [Roseibacterium sp. SDUM158016]